MNLKEKPPENVFEPQVAGTFYPSNKRTLEKDLQNFFENAENIYKNQNIKSLMVPHAGYDFSGQTAMYGYKLLYHDLLLRTQEDYKVIVLAPSHTEYFKGIKVLSKDFYKIPGEHIKIYQNHNLKEHIDNHVFVGEHAIEVQLPFIDFIFKKANKNYSVLPILVGEIDNLEDVVRFVGHEIDDQTILIISSDLSHFLKMEEAKKRDRKTINQILSKNITDIDACGKNPIKIANQIFKEQQTKELKYTNSGEMYDQASVVGYVSIAYYDSIEQNKLIRLAKKAIFDKLHNKKQNYKDLKEIMPEEYLKEQGVFVTLYKDQQLRGCIGNIQAEGTIFESVIENARNAAFGDPRFSSLTKDEFLDVRLEVSILSTPKPCTLEEIDKGDGVILKKGSHSSVYLPQVWAQIEDKDVFLGTLCEKAGLSYDCYKSDVSFEKFSVKIIEEKR